MKGTVESPTEEYMYISVETLRLLCSSLDLYCDIVVPMVWLGLGTTLLVLSSKTRLQIVIISRTKNTVSRWQMFKHIRVRCHQNI